MTGYILLLHTILYLGPPSRWVVGALSPGVKWLGRKAITHLRLVPRLRMRGAIHPLLLYFFMVWCLTEQCMPRGMVLG